MQAQLKLLEPYIARLLDAVFPPRCGQCQERVATQGALCGECWSGLHFISEPCCACCGYPFEFAVGEGMLCAACMQERPSYAQARSVFRYDEHSKSLVLGLKFHDRTHLAPEFARWLYRSANPFLKHCDAIVPVPLHWRRLLRRRFNQSALMGKGLSRLSGVPMNAEALRRIKPTPPQSGLTRNQRLYNVKNAFAVSARHEAQVAGKTLLLIDDVMTTGATLAACTRTLLDAGAKDVYVLTLSRTVQAE